MDNTFEIIQQNRKVLYHYLKETPLEMLNAVPAGFRNNIVWNVGHTIATQQLLVYGLSGLSPLVSQEMIDRYRKGTVPEGEVTSEAVEELKEQLFTTVEKTMTDYQSEVFQQFNAYTTMTKVTLNSVEEAISFNNYHEGLHLGYIMALQKALTR